MHYTVSGHSMHPKIKDGQTVTITKSDEYIPGEIVVSKHPYQNKLIIKEVKSVSGKSVTLMSADYFAEDSRSFGPIPYSSIIGKVI